MHLQTARWGTHRSGGTRPPRGSRACFRYSGSEVRADARSGTGSTTRAVTEAEAPMAGTRRSRRRVPTPRSERERRSRVLEA
jgi:hypothetical protein